MDEPINIFKTDGKKAVKKKMREMEHIVEGMGGGWLFYIEWPGRSLWCSEQI